MLVFFRAASALLLVPTEGSSADCHDDLSKRPAHESERRESKYARDDPETVNDRTSLSSFSRSLNIIPVTVTSLPGFSEMDKAGTLARWVGASEIDRDVREATRRELG